MPTQCLQGTGEAPSHGSPLCASGERELNKYGLFLASREQGTGEAPSHGSPLCASGERELNKYGLFLASREKTHVPARPDPLTGLPACGGRPRLCRLPPGSAASGTISKPQAASLGLGHQRVQPGWPVPAPPPTGLEQVQTIAARMRVEVAGIARLLGVRTP
jgi:hypothetical protein